MKPEHFLSKRAQELPQMTIGKMMRVAEEDKSVISLGPGEPDFALAPELVREAKALIGRGCNHYSAAAGRGRLREAMAAKLEKENKIPCGPENIVVTAGSTEAIMLALMCTVDTGEGVLVPDPGFLAYRPMVEVLDANPVSVPLSAKDNFQFRADCVRGVFQPEKTKVMIINSPSNPTGTVFSRKTLEEIADFAVENDLMIFSDEAYEKLVYDGAKHISIGSLNGMQDRTVTFHTFSKTYAMCGLRVGTACGNEKLMGAMSKLHILTSVCAPTLSQEIAASALTGSQRTVDKMVKEYDRRRKFIVGRLNGIDGVECVEPKGAFYAFPNVSSFGLKSLKFAERLLADGKVACLPGSEFGKCGEGFIRLSYATAYEKVVKAMDRFEKFTKKL